jgi:hypothetical protein
MYLGRRYGAKTDEPDSTGVLPQAVANKGKWERSRPSGVGRVVVSGAGRCKTMMLLLMMMMPEGRGGEGRRSGGSARSEAEQGRNLRNMHLLLRNAVAYRAARAFAMAGRRRTGKQKYCGRAFSKNWLLQFSTRSTAITMIPASPFVLVAVVSRSSFLVGGFVRSLLLRLSLSLEQD